VDGTQMASALDFNSFFNTYKSSVLKKDVGALMGLYDKDLIAFDMWGAWSYIGEGPWGEMNHKWLTSLGSESVLVEFDDISIVSGANVATASATISYKAVSPTGEILRSMQNRLTWVAKQTNGAWKIVHQHTSAPIDPGTMTAILHR
jgi:ketosteroid isomerase-like protein